MTYREQARALNVKYLFGRWGYKFLPKNPDGRIYKLISFIPLDGWTSDPDEILQAMFDDPDFEVKIDQKRVK
jgi:hypothetical protein